MIKRIAITFLTSLSLAAVVPSIGCSLDDIVPTPPSTTTSSSSVTKRVVAAEGGTISDASGKVTLTIPAGALAQDTDISLAVGAAEAGSASSVYEFGPSGTQFSKPATLTVKLDGAVPEGKTAQLSVLEDGAWKALGDNAFAGGIATGNVAHFSKFAIVFVDGKVVAQACVDELASWAGCGGDPKGTWRFSKFCANKAIGSGENPLAQVCPAAKLEGDVTMDGTITVDDTNVTQSTITTTVGFSYIIPTSCYAAMNVASCDALKDMLKADSCSEGNGNCTCKKAQSSTDEADPPKPYTISGTKITIGTDDPVEFCVKGSSLSVEALDKETKARSAIMFLEKQ